MNDITNTTSAVEYEECVDGKNCAVCAARAAQAAVSDRDHLWLWLNDNADSTNPDDQRALDTLGALLLQTEACEWCSEKTWCETCQVEHEELPHSCD